MAAKKINNNEENIKETIVARVNAENGLNLRVTKSLEAEIVTVLPYGTELTIHSKTVGGWTKVSDPNGNEGFVVSEYLDF